MNQFIFVNNVILTPFLIGQDKKINHFVHCPSVWGFWAPRNGLGLSSFGKLALGLDNLSYEKESKKIVEGGFP